MSMKILRGGRLVWALLLFFGLILVVLAASLNVRPATAAPVAQGTASTPSNETCLACHNQPGMRVTLDSGETLSLHIDANAFNDSVHGQNEVACVACHTDITGYPHPQRSAQTLREVAIQYSASCKQCHGAMADQEAQGVHQKALEAGNTNSAVCSDCHNPHTQKPVAEMTHTDVVNICARCHNSIYDTYKTSVHGAALVNDGNTDVPTCVDCHGNHAIQDPTTAAFRNQSPQLCDKCHTDAAMMSKYNISTNVASTYLDDFHGKTVSLVETISPNQPTNKAVCIDCHGSHDVVNVDDPQLGISMKQNLLPKCQSCHPDASQNFTDAWLNHTTPSPQKYALVYYVNLFYNIMIPLIIGGMLLFVITDFIRRRIENRKGGTH